MKKSKKLSDILFNKPAKVKIVYPKINFNKPIPIGHLLAVICFKGQEHEETLFIDNIDVCKSHTMFIFNKNHIEILPLSVDYTITDKWGARVYYKNETSIEIIRIS
jgi:hypothetical protein